MARSVCSAGGASGRCFGCDSDPALAAVSAVLAAPALLLVVFSVSALTLPLIAALATAVVPALVAFVWSPAGVVAADVFGFSYVRLV